MKKYLACKTAIVAYFLASATIAGCSKEVAVESPNSVSQTSQLTLSTEQNLQQLSPVVDFFRGSFISQVNTTTVTDSGSVLIFDFSLLKKFTKGETEGAQLSIAYGDGQFVERGWKYEITIDTTSSVISLAPNDQMKAAIVPGSFKTISSSFDQSTRNFNFITRFKELNGNKNEVAETIFKR